MGSLLSCALARIDAIPVPTVGDAWLSASESKRLASFGAWRRRNDFLAGRWLARHLLAERLGCTPAEVILCIDPGGRSSVLASPGLHVSLSHSGSWIACALAEQPVGIDIERLRPRADLPALATLVHSPTQCRELAEQQGELQLLDFYRLWTLKEAWLKARGLGLDMDLMRRLAFLPALRGDAACAVLPAAGLVLALQVAEGELASLPAELAGERADWQVFEARHDEA